MVLDNALKQNKITSFQFQFFIQNDLNIPLYIKNTVEKATINKWWLFCAWHWQSEISTDNFSAFKQKKDHLCYSFCIWNSPIVYSQSSIQYFLVTSPVTYPVQCWIMHEIQVPNL